MKKLMIFFLSLTLIALFSFPSLLFPTDECPEWGVNVDVGECGEETVVTYWAKNCNGDDVKLGLQIQDPGWTELSGFYKEMTVDSDDWEYVESRELGVGTYRAGLKNQTEGGSPGGQQFKIEPCIKVAVNTDTCEEATIDLTAVGYCGYHAMVVVCESLNGEGCYCEEGDEDYEDHNYWSSIGDPFTDSHTISLEPGDYCVTFCIWGGNNGSNNFTAANLDSSLCEDCETVEFTVTECPGPAPTPTVEVEAIMNYTITASSGSGGSISDEGVTTLNEGDDKTYAMDPKDGYEISDVMVDGVSVGAVESYTFMDVAADHTIYVDFGIIGKVEAAGITEETVEVAGVTEELPYTGFNFILYFFGFALIISGFGLIFIVRSLRKYS